MRAVDIVRKKREGHELSVAEIDFMVAGIGNVVADYQWSALLMAILWRGMTDAETAALTDSMMQSGSIIELASIPGRKIDKHSTGGVGDKTSMILAPIVAATGVPVLCLSIFRPGMLASSMIEPDCIIESVKAAVSASVIPRQRIAIKSADHW